MKKIFITVFLILSFSIYSDIPDIPEDYIIFQKANEGYDLYIKKVDGIGSILLTESQKDPLLKITNYGLRTPKFHPCNGNEIRLLDGKILHTQYDIYFLVDSTTEKFGKLGESFHFYLPEKVLYGYNWTRQGSIDIKPGIKINLRLFQRKYADYNGAFKDQWITLNLSYDESRFNRDVIVNLSDLTKINDGKLIMYNEDDLGRFFLKSIPDNVTVSSDCDVIFIVDCTISMKEEMPVFKRIYSKLKEELQKKVKNLRLGLIVYRDYGEAFLNRSYDLTDDLGKIDYLINRIDIEGGDDVPEALNEAVYELKNFTYKSSNRIAFLICDAPAHPTPRGKIAREDAINVIKDLNIKFNSICLPVK
jgi:hypothetical protein